MKVRYINGGGVRLKDDLQFYIFLLHLIRLLIKSKRHLHAKHLAIGIQLTFYCSKITKLQVIPGRISALVTAAMQAVITHDIITRSGDIYTTCQHIL